MIVGIARLSTLNIYREPDKDHYGDLHMAGVRRKIQNLSLSKRAFTQ